MKQTLGRSKSKIVIDIALVLSIFQNSFKVRLINMALIAENACDCYQVILHPTSKWSHLTSQIAQNRNFSGLCPKPHWEAYSTTPPHTPRPLPRPTQLQYLPFFSSFIVMSKSNEDLAMERRFVT